MGVVREEEVVGGGREGGREVKVKSGRVFSFGEEGGKGLEDDSTST